MIFNILLTHTCTYALHKRSEKFFKEDVSMKLVLSLMDVPVEKHTTKRI